VNRLEQQEARQSQMISSPPAEDSALVAAVLRMDRKQQRNLSPSTPTISTGTYVPAWPRCTTKWKTWPTKVAGGAGCGTVFKLTP
jgi:hypothetical protein